MYLSLLQKYILKAGYESREKRCSRDVFIQFYSSPFLFSLHDRVNAITRSIERLIDKGLLVGYGVRTPRKWFINEVGLTAMGRREAKRLRGEQQVLPLKTSNTKMQ